MMKTFTRVVVAGAVASLLLSPSAFAQTDRSPGATPAPSRSPSEPARGTSDKTPREAFKAPDGVMESGKIIGTRIKDSAGKDHGEIDQLLVDAKTGKITHAVIGRGGLAGIGETKV